MNARAILDNALHRLILGLVSVMMAAGLLILFLNRVGAANPSSYLSLGGCGSSVGTISGQVGETQTVFVCVDGSNEGRGFLGADVRIGYDTSFLNVSGVSCRNFDTCSNLSSLGSVRLLGASAPLPEGSPVTSREVLGSFNVTFLKAGSTGLNYTLAQIVDENRQVQSRVGVSASVNITEPPQVEESTAPEETTTPERPSADETTTDSNTPEPTTPTENTSTDTATEATPSSEEAVIVADEPETVQVETVEPVITEAPEETRRVTSVSMSPLQTRANAGDVVRLVTSVFYNDGSSSNATSCIPTCPGPNTRVTDTFGSTVYRVSGPATVYGSKVTINSNATAGSSVRVTATFTDSNTNESFSSTRFITVEGEAAGCFDAAGGPIPCEEEPIPECDPAQPDDPNCIPPDDTPEDRPGDDDDTPGDTDPTCVGDECDPDREPECDPVNEDCGDDNDVCDPAIEDCGDDDDTPGDNEPFCVGDECEPDQEPECDPVNEDCGDDDDTPGDNEPFCVGPDCDPDDDDDDVPGDDDDDVPGDDDDDVPGDDDDDVPGDDDDDVPGEVPGDDDDVPAFTPVDFPDYKLICHAMPDEEDLKGDGALLYLPEEKAKEHLEEHDEDYLVNDLDNNPDNDAEDCLGIDICQHLHAAPGVEANHCSAEEMVELTELSLVEEAEVDDCKTCALHIPTRPSNEYCSRTYTDNVDSDGDGLSDRTECHLNTDIDNVDSDNDTCWDGDEVNLFRTNPLVQTDCVLSEIAYETVVITDPKENWVVSQLDISGITPPTTLDVGVTAFPASHKVILPVIEAYAELMDALDQVVSPDDQAGRSSQIQAIQAAAGQVQDAIEAFNTFVDQDTDLDYERETRLMAQVDTFVQQEAPQMLDDASRAEQLERNLQAIKTGGTFLGLVDTFKEVAVGDEVVLGFNLTPRIPLDDGVYDLVAVARLNNKTLNSDPVRVELDGSATAMSPQPEALDGLEIDPDAVRQGWELDSELLNEVSVSTHNGRPVVSGQSVYGAQIFAVWESLALSSSIIVDSSEGVFDIQSPRELEKDEDHTVTLYAVQEDDEGNMIRSNTVSVDFRVEASRWWIWLIVGLALIGLAYLIARHRMKKIDALPPEHRAKENELYHAFGEKEREPILPKDHKQKEHEVEAAFENMEE